MALSEKRKRFIDESARKPSGEKAKKVYYDPKSHYKSFKILIEELHLCPDDIYLEIGCGGGFLLHMALKNAGRAAAIDHSPDMVEVSRKKNAQAIEEGRAEIVQGDAADLPWGDNSFTAAASANMVFFVDQPEKVLREVCRALKPGGRFAMVTMNNGLLGKLVFGWLYQLRTYSQARMRGMLKGAGYTQIRVKTKSLWFQMCYAEKPE